MGDTKWGFKANYGHRHLPFAWHSSSGFNYYDHEALNKKSFRPDKMPVSREEFLPVTTQYVERAQDARWSMSNYGCHRELEWDQSLRMPRNPFPGKPNREMDYLQASQLVLARRGPSLGQLWASTKSSARGTESAASALVALQ
eukprot:TRINITY_DN26419_c0_g1_i1.p1 TRINITY_DN26419_c0_g1~~TRINITY_DN26419_c0_g1_i1.p1  ORF type:complete len:143 (+),score=22.54 TRINITY_DN26419_c0_g1_i1:71-499(+)